MALQVVVKRRVTMGTVRIIDLMNKGREMREDGRRKRIDFCRRCSL
jgi:hypothetical protein